MAPGRFNSAGKQDEWKWLAHACFGCGVREREHGSPAALPDQATMISRVGHSSSGSLGAGEPRAARDTHTMLCFRCRNGGAVTSSVGSRRCAELLTSVGIALVKPWVAGLGRRRPQPVANLFLLKVRSSLPHIHIDFPATERGRAGASPRNMHMFRQSETASIVL